MEAVPKVPAVQLLRSVQIVSDYASGVTLSGFAALKDLHRAQGQWVEQGLENGLMMRDDRWSESIAVGRREFVEKVRDELGVRAAHRDVIEADGVYTLREQAEAYGLSFVAQSEASES